MTREMGSLGSGRSRLLRRARLEDFGTRRALGIFQLAVLRHDQRAAKRDHHQDSEESAQDRDQNHASQFEVEAEDQYRRHRHPDAKGDRFAGGAGRLHDVVLEDRRVAKAQSGQRAKERDRDHCHWYRCADREPDLQDQIKRGRAKDDSEQRADMPSLSSSPVVCDLTQAKTDVVYVGHG